jgi:hypothetical protein
MDSHRYRLLCALAVMCSLHCSDNGMSPVPDGGGDQGQTTVDMSVPPIAPGRICSADGWCWENPLPQGLNLEAVWGLDTNNVWAVGELGTVL